MKEKRGCYNIIDCVVTLGDVPFMVFGGSGDDCKLLVATEGKKEMKRKKG